MDSMSELVESVKDVFKGGTDKKKKIILFGVLGAAVVGLALYARSKGGAAGSGDSAGIGDDTSGSGAAPQEADLSGLIDGFGSEIDRLDARIANLGMPGQGYTTLDGSGGVYVPNTGNMTAYAPMPEELTVSTSDPIAAAAESALDESRLAAEVANNSIIPTASVLTQAVAPAPAPTQIKSPYAVAAAPAPAVVKLVIAPKVTAPANPSYIGVPSSPTPTVIKTAAPAPVKVAAAANANPSYIGVASSSTPTVIKTAQPVAAAAPVVKSPVSMPVSPLNPAPTTTVKLATGKTVTVPVKKPTAPAPVFNNPSRLY